MKVISHDVRLRLAAWVDAITGPVTVVVQGRHTANSLKTSLYNAIKLVKDGKVQNAELIKAAEVVSVFVRPVVGSNGDFFEVTLQNRDSMEQTQALGRVVSQSALDRVPGQEVEFPVPLTITRQNASPTPGIAAGLNPAAVQAALDKAMGALPPGHPQPTLGHEDDSEGRPDNPFFKRD